MMEYYGMCVMNCRKRWQQRQKVSLLLEIISKDHTLEPSKKKNQRLIIDVISE
jgi:hypothetical protein